METTQNINPNRYTFKLSAFAKKIDLTLEEDALLIDKEEGTSQRINYHNVKVVNPKFVGSKNFPNLYQTELILDSGEKIKIRNQSYAGLASMDDQSAAYSPFILALHQKIGENNSAVVFKKGYSPLFFWLSMTLYAVFIPLLLIAAIGLAISGQYLYMAGLAFGVYILIRQARKFYRNNKPTIYTPDTIPEFLLP